MFYQNTWNTLKILLKDILIKVLNKNFSILAFKLLLNRYPKPFIERIPFRLFFTNKLLIEYKIPVLSVKECTIASSSNEFNIFFRFIIPFISKVFFLSISQLIQSL